jgi:HPr kinase/phosphorylase
VLLLGPSGCGKSDLALRLLECGFVLVADDRVDIADGIASAPASLVGLLEVRGLGILRLPYAAQARLALVIDLAGTAERLPQPEFHTETGLPLIYVRPEAASAPLRVARALDCALGRISQVAGSFQA